MQVPINKNSVYAPIRYEATRPYAVTLGKAFAAAAAKGEKARLRFIHDLLPLLQNAAKKIGRPNGPGPVQNELINVQIFGHYAAGSRIVFDVAAPLASAMLHSDADSIPCSAIPLPCDSFYMHFGPDSGLTHNGATIEGAFVTKLPDRLLVDLAPKGFGSPHFLSTERGKGLIGAPILLTDGDKPVPQALRESIDDVIRNNQAAFEQVRELEEKLTAQYGQPVRVPAPVEDLQGYAPLLEKALGLIVNSLFYMSAQPEDITDDWGADTPAQAVARLAAAKSAGELKTLTNTLTNAGYRKVRFVGRAFAASKAAVEFHKAVSTGRTVATHFRRGHFRHQVHGPERSLRKWILVPPTVINAARGEIPEGRIYDVQPKPAAS